MSSSDVAKLAQLRGQAAELVQQWSSHQASACRTLGTVVNMAGRLPALLDARHFGALPSPAVTQALVVMKQAASLDALLGRLHASLADFEQVVRALERLCVDAARAVDRAPGAAFLVQPQGVQPSPATCLESVEDVWRMCREELCLKAAIVSLTTAATPPAELAALLQVFAAEPNIDKTAPSYLLLTTPLSR